MPSFIKSPLKKIKAILSRRSMSSKATEVAVLPLVKNNSRPSGFAAYAKAVRKYNIDTPVLLGHNGVVFKRQVIAQDAHRRRRRHHHHRRPPPSGGEVPSLPEGNEPLSEVPAEDVQNDLEYVVPVTIGTPGVTLNLDFDTGSSDLWVWSSELRSNQSGHNIYNPSKSSTAKQLSGATWNISYGDGSSASGNVYTDTIKIGALTIPNQGVELAEQLSSAFLQGGSDGLLGLAWPSINTVQPNAVPTPVENIIKQNLGQGLFSVALDQGDNNGFYTFGGIDATKAGVQESSITYTSVDNSEGFWMFPSETTVINGKTVTQSGNTAILDTGTTLCLLSDEVTSDIYKAIPGATMSQEQGGWVYPTNAKVPTVTLSVGSSSFQLNAAEFAFGDAGDGMTFGGIQSRGNNPFDILGDVFLKISLPGVLFFQSIYAVFDEANVRIGVAQRTGNVQQ
ncbi:hypothetical protein Clacol_004079 [Clathrus columnatus]|uniref:Peptidase A1 domain-containing protein n=1 Tax=Clathrus columnatus TaxID=1419009 RepID=A0AAV5A6E2_9AGAM|nr:hypothetical protein Clacol_004079 [Clathrus columnatus]